MPERHVGLRVEPEAFPASGFLVNHIGRNSGFQRLFAGILAGESDPFWDYDFAQPAERHRPKHFHRRLPSAMTPNNGESPKACIAFGYLRSPGDIGAPGIPVLNPM